MPGIWGARCGGGGTGAGTASGAQGGEASGKAPAHRSSWLRRYRITQQANHAPSPSEPNALYMSIDLGLTKKTAVAKTKSEERRSKGGVIEKKKKTFSLSRGLIFQRRMSDARVTILIEYFNTSTGERGRAAVETNDPRAISGDPSELDQWTDKIREKVRSPDIDNCVIVPDVFFLFCFSAARL